MVDAIAMPSDQAAHVHSEFLNLIRAATDPLNIVKVGCNGKSTDGKIHKGK